MPSGSVARFKVDPQRRRSLGITHRSTSSVFDFVQGITALVRDKPHQDARLDLEAKAKTLRDQVAA